MPTKKRQPNRYAVILRDIFFRHYQPGCTEFQWSRSEIEDAAKNLGINLPKNLGDVLYSFRFRVDMPPDIVETADDGMEWSIELAGRSTYAFRQRRIVRLVPSDNAYQIKIPDATPEIINMYAKTDEQALLAKVRYNRLVDTFLRITAHSLQNHLRTTVPDVGQIEIDELYVGVRNTGQQFIVPVQAKGGDDHIGATQIRQDLQYCRHAFPVLTPRLLAVQFLESDIIVMFEVAFQDDDLRTVDEKHYHLVPGSDITQDDLRTMEATSD